MKEDQKNLLEATIHMQVDILFQELAKTDNMEKIDLIINRLKRLTNQLTKALKEVNGL